MSSDIEIDIPEKHGISSQIILNFVKQIENQNLEVNTFILLRDGKNIVEFYCMPYRKGCQQLLFSTTKIFTSMAAGIAWDGGYFNLDDKVISFFPDKLPEAISPNLEKMTIHNLLSMNTGHEDNIYSTIYPHKDWVKAFLSIEVEYEPGTYYRYSTHASHMLSAIIEKVTGQNMVDFLMPRLFGPLGIGRPSWETGPDGITAGGMGLSIPTEGVARFGQMLLNRGLYNGHRIVSEEYIRLATTKHSDNSKDAKEDHDKQGYGYHIQLCRNGCYRHVGSFGQLCFIAPKEKIVIVATSKKRNFEELSNLIYKYILNCVDDSTSMYRIDNEYKILQNHLANMTIPLPVPKPIPDGIPNIENCSYVIDKNLDNLNRLNFALSDKVLRCEFIHSDRDKRSLIFNFEKPVYTSDIFVKDIQLHKQGVITYANWQDKNILELTMIYIETPYIATYSITFNIYTIDIIYNINVSLTESNYNTTGRLIE